MAPAKSRLVCRVSTRSPVASTRPCLSRQSAGRPCRGRSPMIRPATAPCAPALRRGPTCDPRRSGCMRSQMSCTGRVDRPGPESWPRPPPEKRIVGIRQQVHTADTGYAHRCVQAPGASAPAMSAGRAPSSAGASPAPERPRATAVRSAAGMTGRTNSPSAEAIHAPWAPGGPGQVDDPDQGLPRADEEGNDHAHSIPFVAAAFVPTYPPAPPMEITFHHKFRPSKYSFIPSLCR